MLLVEVLENLDFITMLLSYDFNKLLTLIDLDFMSNLYLANIAKALKINSIQNVDEKRSIYSIYPLLKNDFYHELYEVNKKEKLIILSIENVLDAQKGKDTYIDRVSIDFDTGKVSININFVNQNISINYGFFCREYRIENISNEFIEGLTCKEIIPYDNYTVVVFNSASKYSFYSPNFYKLIEYYSNI
jgi:hypothetical protein